MDRMEKYLGQRLDDRYDILEAIGSGGMAVVFKAKDNVLNRFVAIKMLRDDLAADEEFRRRFQTESQAVAKLSHPNIVSVFDVSRTPEHEYIVMELIDGITLKQYMTKKHEPLSPREATHFAIQIAKALSHAHSRGIIHRDIKPHNIMLLRDGTIKVADFGIARLVDTQNTMSQGTFGTVHYISPEQAKGEDVDERSDIYSFGIVLYEMITGQLPFDGDTPVAVAVQHISSVAEYPSEINPSVPEALEIITMTAMNPNLDERYESADAILADLEEFRKSFNANQVAVNDDKLIPIEGRYIMEENVRPLGNTGELNRGSYMRRRSRASRVSLLSGLLCVLVFIVAVAIFLWNYWVRDVFSEADRIDIPSFVDSDYETVIFMEEYKGVFSFTVLWEYNPDVPANLIFRQTPEGGSSVVKPDDGILVTLWVSSSQTSLIMPNVVNKDYRIARDELEKLGFTVELEYESSSSVTKDYVISTVPEAREEIPVLSTVRIIISKGPEITMIAVPELIGKSQAQAIAALENVNLTYGNITTAESEAPTGTVIWQSPEAGTQVEEHSKVNFQVSTGPAETPPEEPDEGDPDDPEIDPDDGGAEVE